MGPHTMLDEGIERCLDLIQETAGINALLLYSHTYDEFSKPPQVLADVRAYGAPELEPKAFAGFDRMDRHTPSELLH